MIKKLFNDTNIFLIDKSICFKGINIPNCVIKCIQIFKLQARKRLVLNPK